MDEISTGLDSSTTYQIVKDMGRFTHQMTATVLISLLQPAPETFNLFDDVLLLSEGQIVYHGPLQHVMEFFESCGFKCPERKGIADFLQEVANYIAVFNVGLYNNLSIIVIKVVSNSASCFGSLNVNPSPYSGSKGFQNLV